MSTPAIRQYRPLTGEEIIDYACQKLREAMENSGQFPLHRVFHEARFAGGIKVSGWGTKEARTTFEGSLSSGDSKAFGVKDASGSLDVAVSFSAEPEAPDLVRERLAQADAADLNNANCPNCGKFIDSKSGMRIHQARWCKGKLGVTL